MITHSACSVECTFLNLSLWNSRCLSCLGRGWLLRLESATSPNCLHPKFFPFSFSNPCLYLPASLAMGLTEFLQQPCSPVQLGAMFSICPAPLGFHRMEQLAVIAYQGLCVSWFSGYDQSITKPIQWWRLDWHPYTLYSHCRNWSLREGQCGECVAFPLTFNTTCLGLWYKGCFSLTPVFRWCAVPE